MTTDRAREKVARALWHLECEISNEDEARSGRKPQKWADPWHPSGCGVRQQKYYLISADAAISAHTKALQEELQRPFAAVFLDGRNEHGSHVLPMPGDNLGHLYEQAVDLLNDQSIGYAERIVSEAETLGHGIGHCVITAWRVCSDGEVGPWLELVGVSTTLTALFFGGPQRQDEELALAQHTKGEGE